MTSEQLQRAIADIARLHEAGWLADLEHDMAEWQEPFVPPMHGAAVQYIARAASRILGVSPRRCLQVATEVLSPTRERHALELIDWYVAGLSEKQVAEHTDAAISRARKRTK
jgi:hypothetical protein